MAGTFPTLPGIDVAVTRAPVYSTLVQTSSSGKELRLSRWAAPRYRFNLKINVLRASENEVATLLSFIDQQRGRAEPFSFADPYDAVVRGCRFDQDDFDLEQIVIGAWDLRSLRLITVLG